MLRCLLVMERPHRSGAVRKRILCRPDRCALILPLLVRRRLMSRLSAVGGQNRATQRLRLRTSPWTASLLSSLALRFPPRCSPPAVLAMRPPAVLAMRPPAVLVMRPHVVLAMRLPAILASLSWREQVATRSGAPQRARSYRKDRKDVIPVHIPLLPVLLPTSHRPCRRWRLARECRRGRGGTGTGTGRAAERGR